MAHASVTPLAPITSALHEWSTTREGLAPHESTCVNCDIITPTRTRGTRPGCRAMLDAMAGQDDQADDYSRFGSSAALGL